VHVGGGRCHGVDQLGFLSAPRCSFIPKYHCRPLRSSASPGRASRSGSWSNSVRR
jgi:hypothetical protein